MLIVVVIRLYMRLVYPTISVIVPVYNAEKYLIRCVDSILCQSFRDFELILVNDGSLDYSGQICEEYSKQDTRVRMLYKQNGGVSSARNLGLDNARGKWVVFVDSDDWCEMNYLQDFITLPDLSSTDIVIQGRMNNDSIVPLKEGVFNDISKGLLYNDMLSFGAPYCKLYSRELINKNNIRFPLDYSYGEDTTFFLKVLFYAKRMVVIEKYNYHYMDNIGASLSKKDHDYKPLEHFLIDSMNLVFAIDRKYKSDMLLVNAYIPHYKNIILRSIVNIYRLGYSNEEKEACFKRIKMNLLPYLKPSNDMLICMLRILPAALLRHLFGIIMKFHK